MSKTFFILFLSLVTAPGVAERYACIANGKPTYTADVDIDLSRNGAYPRLRDAWKSYLSSTYRIDSKSADCMANDDEINRAHVYRTLTGQHTVELNWHYADDTRPASVFLPKNARARHAESAQRALETQAFAENSGIKISDRMESSPDGQNVKKASPEIPLCGPSDPSHPHKTCRAK